MRKIEKFENSSHVLFINGPCQIESKKHCMYMADKLVDIHKELNGSFVFKASYDKANRTSISGTRGVGIDEGLDILNEIKQKHKIEILTDVHECNQVERVAQVADIIQIPAFLCRQTDLLIEAGKSGKMVNIKKGQFLSPYDMINVIKKVEMTGNKNILITERGSCFGYNNLVVDMRSLVVMKETGYPVIFDATHSVQTPGGNGTSSSGQRNMIAPLARAAVAIGIAGLFMEVHNKPEEAKSDGANSFRLEHLSKFLSNIITLDSQTKAYKEVKYE